MAWVVPVAAAAAGLAGSYMNSRSQSQAIQDQLEAAKLNIKFQKEEAERQREFARNILDMSRPQMSATELGNLLFAQGQQTFDQQNNGMLTKVLAQNLRAGSPQSGNDITSSFSRRSAETMDDRRVDATLKGITGTLPGAAAIQSAAALYNQPAPQMNLNAIQPDFGNGNMLSMLGMYLPGIVGAFQNNGTQSYGNTGLGNYAYNAQTGLSYGGV